MTAEQRLVVELEGDTTASAVGYADGILWLHSPRAYPPGRPLSLSVQLDGAAAPLSGRCIASKQRPEGDYEMRLRLTNLRRELREGLAASFGSKRRS